LGAAALDAGGVRLLRKPFSNDELLEAVGVALHGDRLGTLQDAP